MCEIVEPSTGSILMKNRPATRPILITTVIRVAFRPWWWKAELIRLDACYAWRIAAGIRCFRLLILWRKRGGKFEWNCARIYTKFLYDEDSMMSSYVQVYRKSVKSMKISTIIVSKILFECSILCEQTNVGFWILTWQQYLIYNISRIFVILFVVRSSHNPLKSCLESYARYHCKHFFRVLLHLYIYLKEYERYFLFPFSYFISILNGFQHFYCGL